MYIFKEGLTDKCSGLACWCRSSGRLEWSQNFVRF